MVYVFLADGFEELEAFSPIDLLRRAGVTVQTVGIGKKEITGSHGILVTTDITEQECTKENLEMVVLPGGMPGASNLEASSMVQEYIDYAVEHNRYVAAICAAPMILGHKNLLDGKKATCFPGFEQELIGANYTAAPVEVADHIITARGAGVALEFALTLVGLLKGTMVKDELEKSLQCR